MVQYKDTDYCKPEQPPRERSQSVGQASKAMRLLKLSEDWQNSPQTGAALAASYNIERNKAAEAQLVLALMIVLSDVLHALVNFVAGEALSPRIRCIPR